MLDELRKIPLFADLSEEDLERLYKMAETVSIPAGELVLREGDQGDSLFVVLDGELEVTKRQGSQDVLLALYKPGQFFGEMALLEQAPRSASVRTLQESRLLVISQVAFQTLLSCSPSAPLKILHTVTSRLRSTESASDPERKDGRPRYARRRPRARAEQSGRRHKAQRRTAA